MLSRLAVWRPLVIALAVSLGFSMEATAQAKPLVMPLTCNPAIGCTAGNPPTVSFSNPISGTIRSNTPINETISWCDDGGLVSGSRVVTQNGSSLSTTFVGPTKGTCWQQATSALTFTPVPGNNVIYASIQDNFNQVGSAQFSFFYDTTQVIVNPKAAAKSKPTVTSVADTFSVQSNASTGITYNLTVTCSNPGTLNCSVPGTVTVGSGSSSSVVVTHMTRGWNSQDTITLRATSPDGHQTDAGSIIITASQYAVTASFDRNVNDNQNLALCENDCFAATASHSSATYRSLGVDRGTALIYTSGRSSVRPYLSADITLGNGTTPPNEVQLTATINGVAATFTNGDNTLRFATAGWQGGKTYRIGGYIDARALATNMHALQLTATAVYSDHNEVFTTPGGSKLMVVNLNTPDLLPVVGWTVSGIQRLYLQSDGTVLIVEGDGSGVYFSCTSYSSPCGGPNGDFSTLHSTGSGPSLVFTRAYPDSTKVLFDNTGHMTQTVDRWGNSSSVSYDESGHISSIGDPILPSELRFNYSASSFTVTLPRPNGGLPADTRPTTVAFDGSGRVTAITDPDAIGDAYAYDVNGRLTTIRNRLGDTTQYYYDATSWTLDSIAMPAVPIDVGGGQTQNQRPTIRMRSWQRVGTPTSSTSTTPAAAAATDTVYGRVVGAVFDTTKYTADRWGQPLVIKDPLGDSTTIVRSGVFPTSVTNQFGHTDVYQYTNGLLMSSTPYGQPTTSISYDAWGMPSSTSGGNNPTVTRTFNPSASKFTSTVDGSYISIDSVDARGRVVLSRDAAGHTTRYHYHTVFGTLDSTTADAGQWSWIRFDGYGRDSATSSSGQPATVRRLYDVLGRDSLVYDGVNPQPTKLTYNALYLTTVRDAKGQVYRHDVNALGWMTTEYDPADTVSWTRTTNYRYDVGGRVTNWQNRHGSWIAQQWDKLGRLTSRRDTTGTADSLSYSPDGRFVVGSNAVSVDTIWTGDRGEDTVVTHIAGQWIRRVHTAIAGTTADSTLITSSLNVTPQARMRFWSQSRGVLDSMRVGTLKFAVGYDAELLPDTLVSPAFKRVDSTTSTHQLYARSYANAFTADVDSTFKRSYAYDSLGRIAFEQRIGGNLNGWIFDVRRYAYTGAGALGAYRRSHTQNHSCNPEYGCIPSGEITDSAASFTYDPVNNLTSRIDSTGFSTTSGTFAAGNRLTAWGGTSYTYDEDGNRLTRSDGTTYTWSATGRLRRITNGGNTVDYAYNAFGELVRRTTNGVVDHYFVWDQGRLFVLLNGSGALDADYAYLPGGEPLVMTSFGISYYYHTDGRGNVVGLSTGSGTILQHQVYGPWGETELATGKNLDTTRLGWKGYVFDGGIAGLYYAKNRWYDPGSRTFISEDPLGIEGGINTTAFASNDPVNGWDPDGLSQERDGGCQKAEDLHYPGIFAYDVGGCPTGGGGGILDFWAMMHASGPVIPRQSATGPSPYPWGHGGAAGQTLKTERKESEHAKNVAACKDAATDLATGAVLDALTWGAGRSVRVFLSAREMPRAVLARGARWASAAGGLAGDVSDVLTLNGDNASSDPNPLRIFYDLSQFVPYWGTFVAGINTVYSCGKLLRE